MAPVIEEAVIEDINNQIPNPIAPAEALDNMQPVPLYEEPLHPDHPGITDPPPVVPVEDMVHDAEMVSAEIGDMATSEAIRHIEDKGVGLPNTISEKALQSINVPVPGELDNTGDQDGMYKLLCPIMCTSYIPLTYVT